MGKALTHQMKFINSKAKFTLLLGGYGCLSGDTKIYTEYGLIPISHISQGTKVLSLNHNTGQLELQVSSGAFPKGVSTLHRVSSSRGQFEATSHHRIFSSCHTYQRLDELGLPSDKDHSTVEIPQLSSDLLKATMAVDQLSLLSNVQHCSQIDVSSISCYGVLARLYGQLLLKMKGIDLTTSPLSNDVLEYISESYYIMGGHTGKLLKHIRHGLFDDHLYTQDFCHLVVQLAEALEGQTLTVSSVHISDYLHRGQQFHPNSEYHHKTLLRLPVENLSPFEPVVSSIPILILPVPPNNLCSIVDTGLEQPYWDIQVLNNNNYITEEGTIHHNSGKTESLVYKTLKFLSTVPNAKIGLYYPTVDLIKKIGYVRFEDVFANSGILYKLNKSENVMDIWMPHGKATITFRSMDNYSRIIGYETMMSICDEIDTLSAEKAMEVWVRVLARNRKKFKYIDGTKGVNTVGAVTTPEGFGFTYKMWGKEHLGNPNYEIIRAKTSDNHHLDPDYIENLRSSYPPQLIDAYLNGMWVNLNGKVVYSGFDRFKSNTNLTIDDFSSSDVINIGMDFNVGRMAAAIIMKGDGEMAYQVDELHHLDDTPAMIEAIHARYPNRVIVIFPDASGRSRKSVDASKSDIRLLKDAGFRINAPRKNPPIRQRVLSVNTRFLNGEGERRLFVNVSKCPHSTEQFEKQIYDDNGVPVKDGDEDVLDALGYCVDRVWGLAKPSATIGKMRMGI